MKQNLIVACSLAVAALIHPAAAKADAAPATVYTLDISHPETHQLDVTLHYAGAQAGLTLTLPVWAPGYYQRLDYAAKVRDFSATDAAGKSLPWQHDVRTSTWRIDNAGRSPVEVSYRIVADRDFVASNFLDAKKAFVSPAGVFMYPTGALQQPILLHIRPYANWSVASGLDGVPGRTNDYLAANFDQLYDSPILAGNLERLAPFYVRGVPHQVVGIDLGRIDRALLNHDLRKIIQAAVELMGDVPYRHYTFLETGQTRGGIEHLNSAAVGFGTQDNTTADGRIKLDSFLAHEYFHNFNVKRIRPIELGPFDYTRENRTRSLWVSEGLTVYYEYVLLKRAGLIDNATLLSRLSENIRAYENSPGHAYQSLAQASYETWEDGPFGRQGDAFNKTISIYDKGAVMGFLLDVAIRHASGNRRSLDDVMRALYQDQYLRQHRGFTEQEFQQTCERMAGISLAPLFSYVTGKAEPDYARYFDYAGLTVDSTPHSLDGGWLGIVTERDAKQALRITDVDWQSPAWLAGIRRGDEIVSVDGAAGADMTSILPTAKPGQRMTIEIARGGQRQRLSLTLASKQERPFVITPVAKPDALQQAILRDF